VVDAVDPEALRKGCLALAAHLSHGRDSKERELVDAHDDAHDRDWRMAFMALPESLRFMITSRPTPGTDRSALAASVITTLLKLGWSEAKIAAVIRAHPQGIGARYLETKNNLEADIRRIKDKYAQQDEWSSPDDDLRIAAATNLEMCGIEWLWPGRFALGRFGLIAGMPDMGKGQISAFLAAAVTAMIELPCGEGVTPQG